MFVNILALGSPTHPGPANLWEQWTAPYPQFWRGEGPTRRLAFAPMFGHQYSHDLHRFSRHPRRADARRRLRLFREQPPRDLCQPRLVHRQPDGLGRLFEATSGASPPATARALSSCLSKGGQRPFFGYAARGPVSEPDGRDDGTIAPDRGARLAAVRAGNRDPVRRSAAEAARHLRPLRLQGQLQPELHATPMRRSRPARSIRSTAGSRPTISASTRGRSCSRRRIIATISCGGTCAGCRRSGAG